MEAYRCDVCGKQFAREDNLAQHRKKHNLYQCSDCPQTFATENVLESHRYHHHIQSGRGQKRTSESPKSGPQRKDESPRWITQQKTTELPLLVNKKCGNLTQQQTDIEFIFKIWKSGIYLISYKVFVASFPL